MKKALGVIFFGLLAVLSNPLFLGLLTSGNLHSATSLKLWLLSVLFIVLGLSSLFSRAVKRFSRKYQTAYGLLVSFFVFVFLIIILEFGFHIILSRKSSVPLNYGEPEMFKDDNILGYKPIADTAIDGGKVFNGDTIYDVRYVIDEYSRRKLARPDSGDHLLFFGGSFTFGQGVAQGESFPDIIGHTLNNYQSYNYGFFGYGPQQMLLNLRRKDFLNEVESEKGMAIYTLIDHHYLRNPPSMRTYMSYGSRLPFYDFNEDEVLTFYEPMNKSYPGRANLFKFLGGSKILEFVGFEIPNSLSDRDHKRMARVIIDSRDTYLELTKPENEFFVVIFPGNAVSKNLIPYLEDANIQVMDLSDMAFLTDEEYFYEYDGHPRAKTHKMVAEKILAALVNE